MTGPSATSLAAIDIALRNISIFAERIASRPNYRPPEGETLILRTPACEHECTSCFMSCAIAPARLQWWEQELARLCGSATVGRC